MARDATEAALSILFLAAQRGSSVRIFGQQQLKAFADLVAAKGEIIRNIETYEVASDVELPRIDLGLYQGSSEDTNQSSEVRLAASERRLKEIVEDANGEGRPFVFEVWTDENY